MQRISAYQVWAFDIPLLEPFGIAGGAQPLARNVFVQVTLNGGAVGWGEAAPFPAVSGETQEQVLGALRALEPSLLGLDARSFRSIAHELRERLSATPSARVAVETAVVDALCRSAQLPLWALFGGASTALHTDITLPTGDVAHARAGALKARTAGFSTLKVKVGGHSLELDAQRLRAVHEAAPELELLLDANASLSAAEALTLLKDLGPARQRVVLFEQPTAREDWDGLAEVERSGGVLVAADESARSSADVLGLIKASACSVVNIKTAKLGLVEAWDLMATLRTAGLGIMIGGMVESELSMTASACLAAGLGGVRYVDLDTPLFMGPRPLSGGFVQTGPLLELAAIRAGHGVSWVNEY